MQCCAYAVPMSYVHSNEHLLLFLHSTACYAVHGSLFPGETGSHGQTFGNTCRKFCRPDLDQFALSLGKSLLFATYPNLGENGGAVFILSASWGHLVDSLARQ